MFNVTGILLFWTNCTKFLTSYLCVVTQNARRAPRGKKVALDLSTCTTFEFKDSHILRAVGPTPTQDGREKHSPAARVSPYFFRALAASCVLYNRTEHSQGFFIC